jgi:hypothetical protein
MSRANLEKKLTLDELFGPDFEAELAEVRYREIIDIHIKAQDQAVDWSDPNADFLEALLSFIQLVSERKGLYGNGFWQFESMKRGLDGILSRSRSIDLFPSLGQWLLEKAFDYTYDAYVSLYMTLDRFAAFARIAVARCLSTITFALTTLRRRDPVEPRRESSVPTPRELIGELLSPHILAAGGGFGLFVIRC